MSLTQEQYEKLIPYEQQLRWAVRSNFVHMTNGEFGKLAALYKEFYGEGLTQGQMTCNTCRIRALKRLGEDYIAFQQALAEAQKEEAVAEEPTEKKKAGRKKKIDIE